MVGIMKIKKCIHSWTIGTTTWIKNKPKIKTECIICNETIIVDFKDEYTSEKEKVENDRSFGRPKSFS